MKNQIYNNPALSTKTGTRKNVFTYNRHLTKRNDVIVSTRKLELRHLNVDVKQFSPFAYRRDSIGTGVFMIGMIIGTILTCLLF